MRQSLIICAALILILTGPKSQGQELPLSVTGSVTFFYYENLAAAETFYGQTLGFEKSFDLGWVKIFDIGEGSSIGIVLEGRGFHATSNEKPVMLSIVTEDVDAWYARLKEMQLPFLTELAPESTSDEDAAPVRGFIVSDPGGYTVEFFQWQNGEE